MRYTTVIDISEITEIYKNPTARLLYLHMSLKAGYHDVDRDLVRLSIRRLSADVGVTVSATRHALHQLERSGLLTREGELWRVKKWVEEQQITTRAKTKREMQDQIQRLERQRQQVILEQQHQEHQQYDPEQSTNSDGYKRIAERFGLNKPKK
jgi:DNA-binding transcriptional regulator YhcF (GntR family)